MKTEYGDEVNISAGILCIVGALIVSGLFAVRVAKELRKDWNKAAPQKIEHQQKQPIMPVMPDCKTRQ